MQLQQISIYPLKSAQGYQTSQAVVQPQGLSFDREFMLAEPNGKFITARKDQGLYAFSALPVPFGVQFFHQDGSSINLSYQDFQHQSISEVWNSQFNSFVAPQWVNQWFSAKLGRELQLRWIGSQTPRRTSRSPETPVAFADGYPLLLTSQQSLNQLQQHCPIPVNMQQFRPNIVIDGDFPFAEQQWTEIQIGEVSFLNIKPCERCVLITRDPLTHLLDPKMEPLRTLKKINSDSQGKVIFGINLIPLNTGMISVGDKVEIKK